jgi:adenylate cyclase
LAREQRRLAAIVAADVAGYSRLMGRDESGTLAQLKALRRDVVDPPIAAHSGRIVKTTGDGLLVEFASVVDAVRCVVEIQTAMAERNEVMPEDGRVAFRVGVNLGDIIIEGDDIFGDGVNIAARLQEIASPGGICVSSRVYEDIRDRLDAAFEAGGAQSLKNIARPVDVWRWAPGSGKAPTAPMLPLPDKPSIAVLPFRNMSGDPEQEYFVDGMVEDIITGLSHYKTLFVIARNSSFTYKGRAVDIRQVGRELGVRYVLEGSIRKAGNRVRITGQLIDATNGTHIWADRFDGDLEDIFELQDQVAGRVIGGIAPSLWAAEQERAKRKIGNLQAYDYFLRANSAMDRVSDEASREALTLARQAIALDPDFALGHALIADVYVQRRSFGWTVDRSGESEEAGRAVRRALELDSNDARVLAWCGQTLFITMRRLDEGAALLDQAVKVNPNFAAGWTFRASTQIALGEPRTAIADLERALRLSPLDTLKFYTLTLMGRALTLCGEPAKALPFIAESLRLRPNFQGALAELVVANVLVGRLDLARQALAEYTKLLPDMCISIYRERTPHLPPEGREIYIDALRKAGLPE